MSESKNDQTRPENSEFEGDPYEGYNKQSDSDLGKKKLVTVDLFHRKKGDQSWFIRVQLASTIKPNVASRAERDIDTGTSQRDYLLLVGFMIAMLVEERNSKHENHNLQEALREGMFEANFKWRQVRGET